MKAIGAQVNPSFLRLSDVKRGRNSLDRCSDPSGAVIIKQGVRSMTTIDWRVGTAVLAACCGAGCGTTGVDMYARAVDAQAERCQQIADAMPQPARVQQDATQNSETLATCQYRLGLLRQLADIYEAERAAVLEFPPTPLVRAPHTDGLVFSVDERRTSR
jgi:hypothetical protein